jgi:hypothetical protein
VGYLPWSIGIVVAGLWVVRLIIQLLIINLATNRFGLRGVGFGLVLYDIALPLITLHMLIAQCFRKRPIYW